MKRADSPKDIPLVCASEIALLQNSNPTSTTYKERIKNKSPLDYLYNEYCKETSVESDISLSAVLSNATEHEDVLLESDQDVLEIYHSIISKTNIDTNKCQTVTNAKETIDRNQPPKLLLPSSPHLFSDAAIPYLDVDSISTIVNRTTPVDTAIGTTTENQIATSGASISTQALHKNGY